MAEHHSLGHAGGAGGKHNHRGVVVFRFREVHLIRVGVRNQLVVGQRALRALSVKHHHPVGRQRRFSGGRSQRQVPLPEEKQRRPGDLDHLLQLLGLGPEVDGNVYGVQLGRGEVKLDAQQPVYLHDGYPVACSNPPFGHCVGQPVDPRL